MPSFVWRDGIIGFSDWAVREPCKPTAVSLRTFSAPSHAGQGIGLLSALVLGALTGCRGRPPVQMVNT